MCFKKNHLSLALFTAIAVLPLAANSADVTIPAGQDKPFSNNSYPEWITPDGNNLKYSSEDNFIHQNGNPFIYTKDLFSDKTVDIHAENITVSNAGDKPLVMLTTELKDSKLNGDKQAKQIELTVSAVDSLTLDSQDANEFNKAVILTSGGDNTLVFKAGKTKIDAHSGIAIASYHSARNVNKVNSLTAEGNHELQINGAIQNGLQDKHGEKMSYVNGLDMHFNDNAPDDSKTTINGNLSTLNSLRASTYMTVSVTVLPWGVSSSVVDLGSLAPSPFISLMSTSEPGTQSNFVPFRHNSIHATFRGADSKLTGNATDYYKVFNSSTDIVDFDSSKTDQSPFDDEGTFLVFTNGASWDMKGKFNRIHDLTLTAASNVNFFGEDNTSYKTLQLDGKLMGKDGILVMHVDGSKDAIAGMEDTPNSDRLLIKGSHEGKHLIKVKLENYDEGNAPEGKPIAKLVNVKGDSEGTFTAQPVETDIDRFELGLKYENDWWNLYSITHIEDGNTPLIDTGIGMNRLDYDALRGRDSTLRERLGHFRVVPGSDGAWVRIDGYTRRDGSLKDRDNGVTIGLDRRDDEGRLMGLFLRYGDGKSHFSTGTSKNRSGSIGAYFTKVYDDQRYIDVVVDLARDTRKLSIAGEPGWSSHDRVHRWSGTAAVEAGKTYVKDRWFVEPRARFTLGALGKATFDTDSGVHVKESSRIAAIARLGAQGGMRIDEDRYVNLTADVLHDFGRVKGRTTFTKDGRDVVADFKNKRTWAELGAAFSWDFRNDFRLYGDVKRALGSGYSNDWRWHVSLEHLF